MSVPVVTRKDREAAAAHVDMPDGDGNFDAWIASGNEADLPDYFPAGDMPSTAEAFAAHRESAVKAERERIAAILHEHDTSEGCECSLPIDVHRAIVGGGEHPAMQGRIDAAVKAEQQRIVKALLGESFQGLVPTVRAISFVRGEP